MSTVAGQADASNRFVQNSSGSSMPRVSFSPSSGVSNCYVFKSRLQEYAQKVGIPTPVYETTKEGPSHQPYFRSTVVVNDIRYDSLTGFLNRKAAEQSAAEVALLELSKSGKINQSISQPVHETGLCKNLLQEYAQKMNYAIPFYLCHKEEVPGRTPLFKCTVEIGGILYIGASARTKKEAEIKAARTALLAIQSSSSDWCDIQNSEFAVVPSKRKTPERTKTPLETANVPRSKKARPRKRTLKQKLFRDKRRNAKGEVSRNLGVIDGQSILELDKTEGHAIEGADCGQLAVSATGNFQGENLVTNLNEDVNNILASNTYGGPESAQPAAVDSLQVNHGADFIPFAKASGGETKTTGVGMVVSVVDNATPRKRTLKQKLFRDKRRNAKGEVSRNLGVIDGQSILELDKTEGHAIEGADCGQLAVSATGNFQGENLVTNLNEDVNNILASNTYGGPESAQPAAVDSLQVNHGADFIPFAKASGGETKTTGVGMVVSVVDNATPAQAEASNSVSGLTSVGERIEVGTSQTTESKTTGAGMMVSFVDNATPAQTEASNSVSGLTPVGESSEVGASQTTESKMTGVGMVVSFVNNAIPTQVETSNSVSGITPVGERIEMGTIQTTESMTTGVGMVVSSMDNANPAPAEASNSLSGITPVGESIEVGTSQG